MIAPSRFQPLDQLDEASKSQPADLTIQGPSRPALLSDAPANNPAATRNQVSPHLFAERHALPEHTASGRDTAMEDQESWTVVQNRKLPRLKPPTTPQPQTLFETIMLRPKAFNITRLPPYQFAYRLRLALPQIKGSDIQCRLLTKSNLAVVDCYTEQAAHLLLNLEHLIIDDQIVQFNTYVALREGRIRGVIHRIKGLTEEQLMQGLTSSTHEIVSARPLGMSNTALITFNGTNLPEYVAFESATELTSAQPRKETQKFAQAAIQNMQRILSVRRNVYTVVDPMTRVLATVQSEQTVKPAAPYSSPHRNASGKVTQKAQQSQEQNFPSLESDHQTLTPQTRTQSPTQPPTQLAVFLGYSKDSPEGKQLKEALEGAGFTLLNTPDQYTRIGGAKQNNTSPDLTWVRHLPRGLPKYAKLEDLYGTGLLLQIGDYVEPAQQAQTERLKLTRAGRAIRSELGLSNEDLPQILPTIAPWEDITVTDNRLLPKHMNQASDKHRRDYYAQRHIEYLKTISDEEEIIHTDASSTLEGKEQLEDASSEQTATLIQGDTHDANYRAKVHRRRKLRAKLEEATKHDAPPPRSARPYEVILRRLQTRSFTTIPVLHKVYPTRLNTPTPTATTTKPQ
ncbi:hypothetical protein HPB52_012762 [Rhipicephalus sanguineus]|uniref:Uncharacterized protein n=1 Tax=Rhipicephalus sanguineus TaxID=34632 RepID=A0A9D4T5N2_RHISA|nr:hypothetical protein HPB52_012762 [Rhipicephalus sanguineus]